MGLIDTLLHTRKKEFTFGPVGPLGPAIEKEKAYLNVLLLSCRVINVRSGLKKFYGTVHSAIEFEARSIVKPRPSVTTVTTPSQLKAIDSANLDKVITLTQRLLGPVPYRGGDVAIEAGLFSVKEADLAGPFLEVLGELSTAAGASVLGAALPFAGPLVKGFDLLAGAPGTAGLEIGISDTLTSDKLRSGTFVAMRAEADSVDTKTLRLDDTNRIVGADGKQIRDFPYFVYQISGSAERDDFFRIPELAATHESIQKAIRENRDKEARDLLIVFKRLAMTSPDLLLKDAQRLAKLVEDEVDAILGKPTPTAVREPRAIRPLKEVPLFGS